MDRVPSVAAALGRLPLVGLDGVERPAAELWAERTAAIVWLRHFGCVFCRELAVRLAPAEPRVAARGGRLVFVGHGSVDDARAFAAEFHVGVPLFVDPTRRTYTAVGFVHGVLSSVDPRIVPRAAELLRAGFHQGRTMGDAFQQGGAAVLTPTGETRFVYVNRHAADTVDVEALVAAV